jgi:dTMP kinase
MQMKISRQPGRPVIIAFEGIDGSGKTRHLSMLEGELRQAGKKVASLSFPAYDEFFGVELGKILSGRHSLGADRLDAKSMALWYAMDRWNVFRNSNFKDLDFVLLNRYTLSSAVYQSVRAEAGQVEETSSWIFELEHGQLSLPQPDLYIVLDVIPATAQKNVKRKGVRAYSEKKLDLYERSSKLLAAARQRYLDLAARLPNIRVIPCMKTESQMKSMEEVHQEIIECLNECGMSLTVR